MRSMGTEYRSPVPGCRERSLWIASIAVASLTIGNTGLWQFKQDLLDPIWTWAIVVCLALLSPIVTSAYVPLSRRIDKLGFLSWHSKQWRPSAPHELGQPQQPAKTRLLRMLASSILVLVVAALFFQVKSERFHGDWRSIVRFVDEGVYLHKRAPLSLVTLQCFYKCVGQPLGLSPKVSIQWVSCIMGGLGLLGTIKIAGLLLRGQRTLIVVAVCSIFSVGAIRLYLGYIEHYFTLSTAMIWFVFFGLGALMKGRSAIPALAFATLSACIHGSGLTLFPAALFVAWRCHFKGHRGKPLVARILSALSVTALPILIMIGLMLTFGYARANESGFGGGDGQMFVPFSEGPLVRFGKMVGTRTDYLFFRPDHLLGIANEQLLVAPLGLLVAILYGGKRLLRGATRMLRKRELSEGSAVLFFVALSAIGFFALTVVWNPDYGPRRDWDLFASGGFLTSIAAVTCLSQAYRHHPRYLFHTLLLITAVNLHRSLPWIIFGLKARTPGGEH